MLCDNYADDNMYHMVNIQIYFTYELIYLSHIPLCN